MEAEAKFWDKVAPRYSKKPIDDVPAYEHKRRITQSVMTPESEVLELGCGTGSTALIHAPFAKHIRATDISDGMLNIARDKAKAKNISNVDFETVSVEDIKVENPVDMIMAHSLIHLLEDKQTVLKQIYNWLKPGGVLVTSTVCMGDSLGFFKYIGPVGKMLGLMPHLDVFTTEELVHSIQATGFEIDYKWRPEKGHSVFIIAKKPE